MKRTLLLLSALVAGALFPGRLEGAATMPEPISYTLRFPAPQTHYVEAEAWLPTGGRPAVDLAMAVWTPGSYMVREFSRQVEGFEARSEAGDPLPWDKTSKNHWRVETRGLSRIAVRYRVYSREMSVRTNFVDAGFALLNGAATFLTLAEELGEDGQRAHEVHLVLPPQWKVAVSALPELSAEGQERRYRAPDFDTLADSPLYAGNARVHRFEVGGVPHLLVNEGEEEGGLWDGGAAARDAERIARQQAAFWGEVPYPRYVFFNLLTETGGGLEHRDSSVLMASRWGLRTRDGRLDWLGLVSHELFHAWNGKRLRPVELGPFDYEREVYTRGLWFVEGMTSYYDDLLVHRAGLATRKELLARLSRMIETLQTSPGRLVQPLDDSSFDAWIKFYRRDENFTNTGTNYYTKGALLGFLLDARIRRATSGRRSLDDVLRLAYRRWSGERGFRPEELRALFDEVGGTGLGAWLDQALTTAAELDYGDALGWYGLRFAAEKKDENGGKLPAAWLGAETEVKAGRLTVTEVKRGTPAHEAGLNVDDEILAIGEYRVPPEEWAKRLESYRPGEPASLLIARRERLLRLPVTFGEKPKPGWKLEVDPGATPEQKARLDAWLKGSAS
ncbi:MAG TPA: PDZ domain-containing protein [Thermoanaerobaculia bacterium]|nr:PDZ domain-containing protein [Thermoanaerobaculia bacterium]